jgi:hypothetical protein
MEFNGINSIEALITKVGSQQEKFTVTMVLDIFINEGTDQYHNDVPVATNPFDDEEKHALVKKAISIFIVQANNITTTEDNIEFGNIRLIKVDKA